MKHWIKICGNTSLEDTQLAVGAGADAVGFVFAASKRRVTVEQVAGIVPYLSHDIEKVGVFVGSSLDEIVSTVRGCGLTGVQLHWNCDAAMTRGLKEQLGSQLRVLRVVHFDAEARAQAEEIAADSNVDGVLVDSQTVTAVGGTGIAFDWKAARETFFQNAGMRWIAAGGLTPENVAEAIVTLRPWGVDVASGVEMAPGRKDAAKVRAFVEAVRNTQQVR